MPDGSTAWLSNDVLLLVTTDAGDVELEVDGAGRPMDARSLDIGASVLQVVVLPKGVRRTQVEVETTDLKAFLRNHLTPLDADMRNRVTDFLASAVGSTPKTTTSQALVELRDVLRERLPLKVNSPDGPRGMIVDHVLRIDDRSFYVKGWAHDAESETVRLTAVSPEGSRVELLDRLVREPRPDVLEWSSVFRPEMGTDLGFICFFELDTPSLVSGPWVFEMENAEGVVGEITGPRVTGDMQDVRSHIFHDVAEVRAVDDRLMADHVSPAMMRIQQRAHEAIKIDQVIEYGTVPTSPEVSIVVPVYKNIELLEAQLAEFADDRAIHEADLVYVLDSPEAAGAFDHLASHLYPIYLVPFRIAFLEHNAGFAGAINAGTSIARGRLLLLLNSDVLPDKPGWLEVMRAFYDSQPQIGALAPKLLYEDDSIQHAGMHFTRAPGATVWQDAQYYKGLHRTFPKANVARTVPAVTAACMMVERALFQEFGGLSGNYVRGDYEDFDLCLRLIESGRQNWYLPDAELYHLEAQSYTADLRLSANRYNVWLHTHLWKDRIGDLLTAEEMDGGPDANGKLGDTQPV